ncbi:MAG: hypothetical protein H6660_10445 [Ardenticatenaceae bacterium]|nr:hypothetical protein [Ardenticatenaceae bacterium]
MSNQNLRHTPYATDNAAHLRQLTMFLLIGFGLIALSLIFWSVLRADALLVRDDNPRLVEAELRIQRGSIWDRNGRLLAQTSGSDERPQRIYPLPAIGPAVGYYSFRHGTAGVEESYNTLLRGDDQPAWQRWWQQTLHQAPVGQDIRLTLDAELQQIADVFLRDQTGALILLELTDTGAAELLTLVSHPGYDPNLLDEQFDDLTNDASAPLLNRVTQSQYQPGLTLQPFLLALALEQGIINLNDPVDNANRPVPVNGIVTRCASHPPDAATWADVLRHQCPGPMQDLADQLGVSGLDQAFALFGLTSTPNIPLATTEAEAKPIAEPALAGIGQGNLTVTPLQLSLALATLAQNGRFPTLQLVTELQNSDGAWQPVVVSGDGETAVSAQTAYDIRTALPQIETFSELSVRVLSGPDESTNVWYLGLYPAAAPRYVLVIVLENDDDVGKITEIGRNLFTAIAP